MPVITIGNVDIGTASDVFQSEDVYETGMMDNGKMGYATHFDDYLLPGDSDSYNNEGEFETIMIADQEIVGKVVLDDEENKYLDLLDEDGNAYLVADTAEDLVANLEIFAQTVDPVSTSFVESVQTYAQQILTAVNRINVNATLSEADQGELIEQVNTTIVSLFTASNQGENAEAANIEVVKEFTNYLKDLIIV